MYRIRTTGTKTLLFRRDYLVCDPARSADGGWYTPYPSQAKVWKTKQGAQRWLDARPEIMGAVENAGGKR